MIEVAIINPIDIDLQQPGGIDIYVRNLIPHLLDYGMKIKLIGVSHNKEGIIIQGDDYEFVPIVQKNRISGYDFFLNLLIKSRSLKLSEDCIIHSQRPDTMFPFVFLYKENPKICTLHGFFSRGIYLKKGRFIDFIYRLIERFTLKRVNGIIAVNEGTRDYYVRKYPWLKDKIMVIPVGTDTERFKPMDRREMREKYGFNEDDKIVLYVGRLEKEKALDLLIKSFNDVRVQLKDARLVLVGGGREREKLENLAEELKLDAIVFMGDEDHDKIPEILNCADVFVLTSLYESGPLVVQEALSCGVPVVSVDVGRVREFISDDLTGKIVSRDRKSISNAIINFLLRTDQVDIKKSCREMASGFDFKNTAKKTIEVYKGVLS